MLEVIVLGSGSSGNALIVRCGDATVLVDAGFSCRDLLRRMAAVGVDPGDISGILLTHEHDDHVRGLRLFLRQYKTPVYAAPQCFDTPALSGLEFRGREFLRDGEEVSIGSLSLKPFAVPHDAAATFGFVYECGGVRAGHATDLGVVTPGVAKSLKGCHCLLVEFNHDVDRLLAGGYPLKLKARIRGELGHLSNEQGAGLLSGAVCNETKAVYLMHLSRNNNLPALARMAALEVLDGFNLRLEVASHGEPSPAWVG
jgi:phosphoribosyl 1,2-cyclic phosphodiesterase